MRGVQHSRPYATSKVRILLSPRRESSPDEQRAGHPDRGNRTEPHPPLARSSDLKAQLSMPGGRGSHGRSPRPTGAGPPRAGRVRLVAGRRRRPMSLT